MKIEVKHKFKSQINYLLFQAILGWFKYVFLIWNQKFLVQKVLSSSVLQDCWSVFWSDYAWNTLKQVHNSKLSRDETIISTTHLHQDQVVRQIKAFAGDHKIYKHKPYLHWGPQTII